MLLRETFSRCGWGPRGGVGRAVPWCVDVEKTGVRGGPGRREAVAPGTTRSRASPARRGPPSWRGPGAQGRRGAGGRRALGRDSGRSSKHGAGRVAETKFSNFPSRHIPSFKWKLPESNRRRLVGLNRAGRGFASAPPPIPRSLPFSTPPPERGARSMSGSEDAHAAGVGNPPRTSHYAGHWD